MEKTLSPKTLDSQILPGIIDRIKAIFTDYVILILLLLIISNVFSSIEYVPDSIRIASFILLFGLYDPLSTAFLGGTFGHLAMGLRVRQKDDPSKKINLPKAILRFFIKFMLGAISLFTVTGNKNKMAIHDMAIDSIVLFKEKK